MRHSRTNPSGFFRPAHVTAVVPADEETVAPVGERTVVPTDEETVAVAGRTFKSEVEVIIQRIDSTECSSRAASTTSEPLLGYTSSLQPVVQLQSISLPISQAQGTQPQNSTAWEGCCSQPRTHHMTLRPRKIGGNPTKWKKIYTYPYSSDDKSIISDKKRKTPRRAASSKARAASRNNHSQRIVTASAAQDDPTVLTTIDDPIERMAWDDSTPGTSRDNSPTRIYIEPDFHAEGDATAVAPDTEPDLHIESDATAAAPDTEPDLYTEVDAMAAALDKEPDAKTENQTQSFEDEPGTTGSVLEGGSLVDAPVYRPTMEEFQDAITYFEVLYPDVVKYGICKVVPPSGWTPPSEEHGDMTVDVMNQYISRLFSRWGPAARELSAIKLCLRQQNICVERPPQLNGAEISLNRLYHTVQRYGGIEIVMNQKLWEQVALDLKLVKSTGFKLVLETIYMEHLLPYDALTYHERQRIMSVIEAAWNKKYQRLLDQTLIPLHRQQRMLGVDTIDAEDEMDDANTAAALRQLEDCVVRGQPMSLSHFKEVASMMYDMMIVQGSEGDEPPTLQQIEEQYWHLVTSGTEHQCVYTAKIDTGAEGYGAGSTNQEPSASHLFNLKKIIEHRNNVLRYLGPLVGVTVPARLLGMVFSTECWHQHLLPQVVFQKSGPARIWYGIPARQANNFKKAVQILSPTSCQNKALWLPSDNTMIPPSMLREHNVRLSSVTQNEGEIILTVPNAYSCCISTGYTESESVCFASPSFLSFLSTLFREARESCEPMLFSMEHLLYNIGCDNQPLHDILECAEPLFSQMVLEEVTNRQMLQELGLSIVLEVKGLPDSNSVLCLEHALLVLGTVRYRDMDARHLQVVVHVSVRELQRVHNNMKRLDKKTRPPAHRRVASQTRSPHYTLGV